MLTLAVLPAASSAQVPAEGPVPAEGRASASVQASTAGIVAGPWDVTGRWAVAGAIPSMPEVDPHRAFLASALLPGGGQWLLGSKRWLVYGAVELGGWGLFLDRRGKGRDLEARYRDLAWSVARSGMSEDRRDGDFEYYEAMTEYAASGAFDVDPGRAGVQPETDATTYNGMVWALARGLYLPAGTDTLSPESAEYAEALSYYRSNAVPEDMRWNWGDDVAARDTYTRLIDRSDAALRTATQALGLVLANHVISAVDALISARLRGTGDAVPDVELRTRPDPASDAVRWSAAVRLPTPWRR